MSWTKERRYWNGFDMKVIEVLLDRDSRNKKISVTEDYYLRSWKTFAKPAADMIAYALDHANDAS